MVRLLQDFYDEAKKTDSAAEIFFSKSQPAVTFLGPTAAS